MKQNPGNRGSGPNKLMTQLVAEKKKTIMALCLTALMVLMWVRMLGRKTPETAGAAVTARESSDKSGANSKSLPKISFIELPRVKGRNDVLAGDFFAVDNWQEFLGDAGGKNSGGIKEVNVVSRDGLKEVIRRVAKKLKLEARELSENPYVFINNKLLSVGDKLLVRDGTDTYECEIVGIEETEVFIRCEEAEIRLKFAQVIEVVD